MRARILNALRRNWWTLVLRGLHRADQQSRVILRIAVVGGTQDRRRR